MTKECTETPESFLVCITACAAIIRQWLRLKSGALVEYRYRGTDWQVTVPNQYIIFCDNSIMTNLGIFERDDGGRTWTACQLRIRHRQRRTKSTRKKRRVNSEEDEQTRIGTRVRLKQWSQLTGGAASNNCS